MSALPVLSATFEDKVILVPLSAMHWLLPQAAEIADAISPAAATPTNGDARALPPVVHPLRRCRRPPEADKSSLAAPWTFDRCTGGSVELHNIRSL